MPNHLFRPMLLLLAVLLLVTLASCSSADPGPVHVVQVTGSQSVVTPVESPTATGAPTQTDEPTELPPDTDTPAPTPTFKASATSTRTSTPLPPTATPTVPPPTDTATPTPTSTPTPAATATATPTPTLLAPTASMTPVPTQVPQPPAATPTPEDGFLFDITMQRMLQIDENGGEIGNHNIYVHAFDAQGNPLNGVVVCRVYALQLQPPDPHACGITGETGPGRMHFDVYSGDIVYVATVDPEHRPLSPHTRPLEQEPAAMADLQELVDNGYCASVDDCQRRIPINNLVRFHYSYEVHFRRR